MDPNFEGLAFPDCFPYGNYTYTRHKRKVNLPWRQYFQQRLLNIDSRFANNLEYLFCAQHISDIKQIQSDKNIALRLSKSRTYGGQTLTAGMLRNSEVITQLVRTEHAYKFMKNIRGSPAYWQSELYDVMAMLRQLGMPTFFLTLSAADLHWVEMITAIGYQIGRSYQRSEVLAMPIATRNELLKQNPITAVRIFQHRVDAFFTHVIAKHPTLKVTDFVTKIEFQARGSPHAHCILWVASAPRIDVDSDVVVTTFIDKYITAMKPADIPHNQHIRQQQETKQQHRFHSDYCRRNHVCRFGFPKAPAPCTIIARAPAEDDADATEKMKNATTVTASVLDILKTFEHEPSLTEVLEKAGISTEIYTAALKIARKGTTIILQRNPSDMHTNACNLQFLHMWNANIDLQFIVDEYSTIMYVCSYMMKSEKEMGELLQRVAKETQNDSVKHQMKRIGKEFINKRVVGAPEAAMRVLSFPLIKKSRKVIFVNGNEPGNRVVLPKSKKILETMEDNDENIFTTSIHDRYSYRPPELKNMCLAMFAVSYDVCYNQITDDHIDTAQDKTINVDKTINNRIKLTNGTTMRKRLQPAILRMKRFKHETEPEQYYYSRLLLFWPWSNEDELTNTNLTLGEQYVQKRTVIEENAAFFRQDSDMFDDIMASAHKDMKPETAWDAIAPSASALEADAQETGYEGIVRNREYDMSDDINILESEDSDNIADTNILLTDKTVKSKKTNLNKLYTREAMKGDMTNEDYYNSIQLLNEKQRDIIMWNRQWCKNAIAAKRKGKTYPAYKIFLSGPGGTGKSHVIKLLHRDIVHFFKTIHVPDIDQPLVLLTAPTGIAAFQINGTTIHSAFNLSCTSEEHSNYSNMSTMQVKLQHLVLSITDEISMVSLNNFQRMNRVLSKVKGTKDNNWGNVCMLAVGDLYQLEPVAQFPVYKSVDKPYNCDQFAPLDWHDFKFHELTQMMRQKDDQDFANKLNSIRENIPQIGSDEDKYFATCEISCDVSSPMYPINAIHLYACNVSCGQWNQFKLSILPDPLYTSVARDSKKDCYASLASVTLPDNPSKTRNLHHICNIKKGAYVMLTTNLDVSDGLTNGARGIVTGVLLLNQSEDIDTILVKFISTKIGAHAKSVSPYKNKHPDSVPIKRVTATFMVKGQRTFRASRTQFPLSLAWAMTVHKCQGLTLSEIVVDMHRDKGKFKPGQAYVAFSRVTSKNGLHILNYDQSQILVSSHTAVEMERLRQHCLPIHTFDLFSVLANNSSNVSHSQYMKLLHLNVPNIQKRSQHMHISHQVQNANIIALNETMLNPSIHIDAIELGLPVDMELFRHDRNENGGGVLLAIQKYMDPVKCNIPVTDIEIVAVQISNPSLVCIVAVYRPPWQLMSHFIKQMNIVLAALDNQSICVVGDFNEDIFLCNSQPIHKFFLDHSYKQHITQPTRDSGTLIDHFYTRNIHNVLTHVSDCYFSDHDFVSTIFTTNPITSIVQLPPIHANSSTCLLCNDAISPPTMEKSQIDTQNNLKDANMNNLPSWLSSSSQKHKTNTNIQCEQPSKKRKQMVKLNNTNKSSHTNVSSSSKRKQTIKLDDTKNLKHANVSPVVTSNSNKFENTSIGQMSSVIHLQPLRYIPLANGTRFAICNMLGITDFIMSNLTYVNTNTLCIHPPMQIHYIKDDGNCLFCAMSFLLTDYEIHHEHIRKSM